MMMMILILITLAKLHGALTAVTWSQKKYAQGKKVRYRYKGIHARNIRLTQQKTGGLVFGARASDPS